MADFDPPFGENGELRAPDATEQSNGIPCGAFDITMFNYLLNLSQGQVKNIADEAGVASLSGGDKTVLFRAVEALIDAATGGNPAGYVLMTQARARLPIFPEVLNADGKIIVTSPSAGTVRVPGGVDFLHRGIFSITTSQADLSTDASKIYHLRWNPNDGFTLKDTSSAAYNPSPHDEGHEDFDTDYDDMLVARIVTNSSNVATITNLMNKDRLWFNGVLKAVDWTDPATNTAFARMQQTLDWARTPKFKAFSQATKAFNVGASSIGDHDEYIRDDRGVSAVDGAFPVNRYETHFSIGRDYVTSLRMDVSFGA